MSYFVVSDVHDHYALMTNALKERGFDFANPRHVLIICGDAFYSGPQPGELFCCLRTLRAQNRFIFIRGNHDVELLDNLKQGAFKRAANRTCAAKLVEHLTGKANLSDAELVRACAEVGFTDFLENASSWYYETAHYVFVHGFIPTKSHAYMPNWRGAGEKAWRTSTCADAMKLSLRYGIREPGKTIVCGHYSAARCYPMKDASPAMWEAKPYKDVSHVPLAGFETFYGEGFIALDASTKKTGFVNCVVLEED